MTGENLKTLLQLRDICVPPRKSEHQAVELGSVQSECGKERIVRLGVEDVAQSESTELGEGEGGGFRFEHADGAEHDFLDVC